MTPLPPFATFDALYPPDTVFAPRTTLDRIRWVYEEAYRPDTATGYTMALMGEMPLICHRAAATPVALDFFRACGVRIPAHLDTYDTEGEFVARARTRLQRGQRLAYVYPPPAALEQEAGLLLPLPLYNWLNDKANLAALVAPEFRPEHQFFPLAGLSGLLTALPGRPVYIKACHPGASGAGSDVRYCPDAASRQAALAWLGARADGLSGVLVEEAVAVGTCWCMNLAVLDAEVRYLGAASQLFSAPASQSGSRIDPDDLPPDRLVAATLAIGERARGLGFRGVAGFDIGMAPDGRPCVFDLNFRIAASTPLVMLHEPATRRVGARVSQSWHAMVGGPLEPALDALAGHAESGRFVPFRLHEASALTGDRCLVTGMVVADSAAAVERLATDLQLALGLDG